MDQFWAPNWPPKSLKSARAGYSDFRTGCSKKLLVPRRPQHGSRGPRGAQASPKMAPKSSQNSPKMGQIGLRCGKIVPRCFQKRPNKAFPLPFLSFAFAFLPSGGASLSYIYPSLSFGEYNSNSNSLCTPLI